MVIVKFSITGEGQVERGVQSLHGKGHPARLPDQGTDQDKVHFWWEGDARVHIHGVDHTLGRGSNTVRSTAFCGKVHHKLLIESEKPN